MTLRYHCLAMARGRSVRVQVSHLVRAPREKTFAAYVDVESIPRWSASTGGVRVISRGESSIKFEVETQTRKGPRMVEGELKLSPPGKVTIENETSRSVTKGTVTFEEAAGGTLVTSSIEVEVKGLRRFFVRPAFGEAAREVAERNLASFAGYVEGLGA